MAPNPTTRERARAELVKTTERLRSDGTTKEAQERIKEEQLALRALIRLETNKQTDSNNN